MSNKDYAAVVFWALDFLRAAHEHSKFRGWLIRLALGRYAFREMMGMHETLAKMGYDPDWEYGIEGCEYHQERVKWE